MKDLEKHLRLKTVYNEFFKPLGSLIICRDNGMIFLSEEAIRPGNRISLKLNTISGVIEVEGRITMMEQELHPYTQRPKLIFTYGMSFSRQHKGLNNHGDELFGSVIQFRTPW